jgi:hypothetical protein
MSEALGSIPSTKLKIKKRVGKEGRKEGNEGRKEMKEGGREGERDEESE